MNRARLIFAITMIATGLAACQPVPASNPKPVLMIMAALPLFWGENGPAAIISGADQRAEIIISLAENYRLLPVDAITPAGLSGGSLLVMAQPRGLSGEELVVLDAWVRDGGRLLVFADPELVWLSNHPPGDPRRPPRATLLDPLLSHWGLQLDFHAEAPEFLVLGSDVAQIEAPGQWSVVQPLCSLESDKMIADCRIGAARVFDYCALRL